MSKIKRLVLIEGLHKFENLLGIASLLLLAVFPFMEVIARIFKTGIPYSTPYTHHLVLFVTFIGGMITSREGQHLSLSISMDLPEAVKKRIKTATMFLAAMMTTAFGWSALSLLYTGFEASHKIGIFPIRLVGMVMVVGYAVMAVRFLLAAPKEGGGRWIAGVGMLVGTFLAMEPIYQLLATWMDPVPGVFESLMNASQFAGTWTATPLIILLVAGAVFGTPLFVVLGGIAFLLFAKQMEPLVVIPNEAYSMLIEHSIPAIPLFTLAGFLLSESGAGKRLVRFFEAFFGWFPGGMAIMAVFVCAFFTTFTGASGVTILALGALLSYVLINNKYEKRFSHGLLTASGSVGLLFPPSLPIIIYGVIAGISIKDMFVGGILPGVVLVSALVIYSMIYSTRKDTPRKKFELKEAGRSFVGALGEILLPVVIVLSYFGGLTTLVESAALAVVYAFVVEVIINRDIKIKDLPGVFLKCIPIIGGVLIILSLAKGLSYYIVDAEVPMLLMEWVQANISSKYVFLLILNIALLITGCFMDIFSAIMVVVPLIIPLGALFGIHPVHLGIIFLANMELGYMTPPVGLNLFLASYRFETPMNKLYRAVLPFFLLQLLAVLLITYVPFLATGLLDIF